MLRLDINELFVGFKIPDKALIDQSFHGFTDAACQCNGMIIGRKEGYVLFNDALNTFYLWLYSVGHMVKGHSDSERKPAATTWATLSKMTTTIACQFAMTGI